MKHLKKIDHQKKLNENYELQEYLKTFNLKRARMRFALESQMVRYFKFNYMSDKNFERKNWSCDFCERVENKYSPDSVNHATVCNEYENLRRNINLNDETHFVDYFINIVKMRNDLTNQTEK